MKIRSLKFKNINSLSGENEIDFTKAVFTNDGLFAITGKTGAGKSSILDAISLALFGKTPRVEITGNENAVMTRGEKDCYSEIVFEVAGKIWKSSWKQEKSRPTAKNPEGSLKPVNRQIADFADKIIADQVRTCDSTIIEIIGLTFEQFTKVILLAQGSFAAFLQADKNDKGQLLEQITGTEIYGEISKKVFERNRSENQKLENINLELGQIKILSAEEITNLENEITDFENEKKQFDLELQIIETAKKWLLDLGSLQKQINETKLKLPELEDNVKIAKVALEQSEITLKSAKEEYEKQKPIFVKVRELDTKILEKENSLKPILKVISDLGKSKNELLQKLESQNKDINKSKKSLTEKQDWAVENKKYEELVTNYTAIEKENQLLANSLKEIKKQKSEIAVLQKDLDAKKIATQKASELLNEKDKNLTIKTKELETKKTELAQILKGKELSELQSEKESITNLGTQIKSVIDIEKALSKNYQEIADCNEKIKIAEKTENELNKHISNDKKTFVNLENAINILDENIKLTKTIQSLDEHRNNLKDGDVCPLCGSIEHPFALGNVPQIGDKEKELITLKKQFQDVIHSIQKNEKALTKLISDKENTTKNKQKEEEYLSENQLNQKEIVSKIRKLHPDFNVPNDENKLELLSKIHLQKQNEYKQVEAIIGNASHIEKLLQNLRDNEIPVLQQEKQAVEKNKNDAETVQKLAEQHLKAKQDLVTKAHDKYTKESTVLLKKLKNYDVDTIEALKKCLDAWNDYKKQTEDLSKEISELQTSIALNTLKLDEYEKQITDKTKEKQTIETDKQKLINERKEMFAEKSVEEEENRLNRLLENAENRKAKNEKESLELNTEFEKNKAVISAKEKELSEKQRQNITEKSVEELQSEFDIKKVKTDEFSQKIGANNQALKSNNDNLKNSGNKLLEKEKQQQVCNKWSALSELIGSSDGKKYRNFAQALTFEHLIGLSNRQLQKMSDRYILKRTGDTSNPFELSVIDKFQNSEERTAQNLSGGEKFIVSLSLALGLANMASKNMRIDTMFIDEGFGTLDSDYLDVALNALSNLQSEGKIIGVISHLIELKERIATHIEVVPSGNGHSKIQITN